ncbi:MAG: alpha/beta hydrolase [Cyanobacteria bacterium J06627_28]
MHQKSDVLWLSVSPFLKCFDQRLLGQLTRGNTIRRWQYCQTIDEPCSVTDVVKSLHEYLKSRTPADPSHPYPKVHLMGHGVSGIIGLLYTRQYPDYVASLTLLSVSDQPAINWQAHYYALRHLLPCSREIILGQMTRLLFGQQAPRFTKALSQLLSKDLDSNITLHSIAHKTQIPSGGVDVPLLVCNGEIDDITGTQPALNWHKQLKEGDRYWQCPEGNHFFHFQQYKETAKVIADYWAELPKPLSMSSMGDRIETRSTTPTMQVSAHKLTPPKQPSEQYYQTHHSFIANHLN